MYAKLLGFLLIACQIVLNRSAVVHGDFKSVNEDEAGVHLPEGYVSFPGDHAAYKIHTEAMKWDEARERCISEGARLAVTDSVEKIAHINSLENYPRGRWVHVGIHKSPDNEWVRVDNDLPMTSVPWASWESNAPHNIEDCAGISLHEDRLVHYSCDGWAVYFVCEIPI